MSEKIVCDGCEKSYQECDCCECEIQHCKSATCKYINFKFWHLIQRYASKIEGQNNKLLSENRYLRTELKKYNADVKMEL